MTGWSTCGRARRLYPRRVHTDKPWDAEQVRDRVGKRINEFLAARRVQMDDISPDVGSIVEPVADFMAGGKRLRAMFLYWGWRAAGGSDDEAVISAAAAMEFLQACALVHDDVMDNSDSRRGRPAMHRQFRDLHETAEWAGDAANFGSAAAILIGDLCLSWADEMLLGCGMDAPTLLRGKPVYDVMRTELMAGQYLDILEQARGNDQVEPALQVVRFKSAKYTIERPLHLGAALAGGDPTVIAALREYGLDLGIAFQLRDDLLGVYGDPRETGKPSGDDLREGKRTVLIALALQDLPPSQADELSRGLDAESTPEHVAHLRELVDTTEARHQVEAMIAKYADAARTALAQPALTPEAVTVLDALIDAATRRVM